MPEAISKAILLIIVTWYNFRIVLFENAIVVKQQQLINQLIHFFFLLNFYQPLQIKSVIAKEGLKGYIYVEAFKQTHVKQAIDGIGNLRMGFYQQQVWS